MENYSINLPSYSIGTDVYSKIPEICSPYGKKVIAIGGKKAMGAVCKEIKAAVAESDLEIIDFLWYGGESSFENVESLLKNDSVQEADMIFAIGGGKALDTCKCLGLKIAKPVFTFPTIASNCAALTCVSIMYRPDGSFLQPFFLPKPPTHAFILTTVLAKAPTKYMWAGIGDTYAKYFEANVSSRGEDLIHYVALGVDVSRMCLEPILQYGAKAMNDNKQGIASYEFEQVALGIIVTTGIASILLTAEHIIDYNTGLAHAVFYALTAFPHIPIETNHLHGEVVAFGVLILLLVDGKDEMFEQMFAFNKSIHLPTAIEDIEVTVDDLKDVIPAITKMADIEHNPYEVTEHMVVTAFAKLADYNNKNKIS